MFDDQTPAREILRLEVARSGAFARENLNRKTILVTGAFALLAMCVWASDPWKNSDYEKWSAKDVDKILNNSPWAKSITIPYSPYLNGDRRETDEQIRIGSAANPSGVADSRIYQPSGTFILRWNSALTFRRALYRDAVLRGLGTDDASQKYLINDEDNIDLVMIPTGQTRLPPIDGSNLRAESYLELRPSGKKIYAVIAEERAWVDAQDNRGFLFSFPQRLKDGTPAIPKDATEIVFFTQVGVRRFEAKFRAAEMMLSNGPDYF